MHVTIEQQLEELAEEIWALAETGRNTHERVVSGSKIPNAAGILDEMNRLGLVRLAGEGDALVTLTPEGSEVARSIIRRHRLAEMLFTQVLSLEEDVTETTACQMAHILTNGVTDSVCAFLGHPPLCPHGKPIPPGRCCKVFTTEIHPLVLRLLDLRVGDQCRVVFIKSARHGRLDRVGSLGLVPGATVKLSQKRPTVVLEIGHTTVALDRQIADEVYVRRLGEDTAAP